MRRLHCGERREFEHFSCPMIDKKGAFTDDNDCYDEKWEEELKWQFEFIIDKQDFCGEIGPIPLGYIPAKDPKPTV